MADLFDRNGIDAMTNVHLLDIYWRVVNPDHYGTWARNFEYLKDDLASGRLTISPELMRGIKSYKFRQYLVKLICLNHL